MSENGTSAYETARAANIRRNQALLAKLNLQNSTVPSRSSSHRTARSEQAQSAPSQRPSKRRKVLASTAPSRASARLAASDQPRPTYNEDRAAQNQSVTRSERPTNLRGTRRRPRPGGRQSSPAIESPSLVEGNATGSVPASSLESIIAGWTSWEPTADPPARDDQGNFHFEDEPTFMPNKSPAEAMREGAFGGSYWRPLKSRKLGIVIEDDWKELPQDWIKGLDIDKFLISGEYDPEVNKYKVACGQSIEEWEASGWIDHDHDVRGWFQWYCRFFQGRRCDDDERQISRWRKCVGETGRWRRALLKKYRQLGVRTVFDDGEDEDAPEVSPVIHQTCHHWAFEVRQETLDAFWAES